MDSRIMKYIPKSKVAAVSDAWYNEDGYWITLREGWNAGRTDAGCRVIHEDNITGIRWQIAGIEREGGKR